MDDVLFPERIEAWDNGPVVRDLWEATRGTFRVERLNWTGQRSLTEEQRQTIDTVLEFYGAKDAQWLSDLTHLEKPWSDAYALGRNTIIGPAALSEYYSTIPAEEDDATAQA